MAVKRMRLKMVKTEPAVVPPEALVDVHEETASPDTMESGGTFCVTGEGGISDPAKSAGQSE